MKQAKTIYLLLVSIAIVTLIIGCGDGTSSSSDTDSGNPTTVDMSSFELTYANTTISDYKEITIEPSKNTITNSASVVYTIFLKEDGKVTTNTVKGIAIEANKPTIKVATSAAIDTYTLTIIAKANPNQDFYIGEITTDITIIINATDLSTFDLTYDTTAKQTFGTANRFPTIRNTLPTAGINYALTATPDTITASVPSGITLDETDNTTIISSIDTKPGIHYITVTATPDSAITRLAKTSKADVVITVEGKALPPTKATITNLDVGSPSEGTDITYNAITVKWSAPSNFGYTDDGEEATFKEYKIYYKKGSTVSESDGTLASTVTTDDASSREATITGLEDKIEYSIIVSTVNNIDKSTTSDILTRFTDTNYSNPPTISITDANTTSDSNSISIRWDTPVKGRKPDGTDATTINWYKIYYKVGTAFTPEEEAAIKAGTSTLTSKTLTPEGTTDYRGATLENLTALTSYAFQVEINTDAGENGLSSYSAVKTATTTQ